MRTQRWEQSTLKSLKNVETGLNSAHAGLDVIQEFVDGARAMIDAGDFQKVRDYVDQINKALFVKVPLHLVRESDLRLWEV